MGKLKGRVAIVTGASKGIGAGIAEALGAEGASVVVNYASDKAGAERVVKAIAGRDGKAVAIQANVGNEPDVIRLFEEATRAFGPPDILVNNSGVYRFGPVQEVQPQEFHRQFDINVLGLILASREAVKRFGPQGGSIINVGSVASEMAPAGSVIYSATKGAVDAVTRVLANELGPRKIRVNSINPGPVDTEGAREAGVIGSDFEKDAIARTPLGRIGLPADIGSIAVFLASPESGWLTGEILHASGGFR